MILHRLDPPYCEIFEIRNTILNSDVPDTADRKTKRRTQTIPKRYALGEDKFSNLEYQT